MTLGTCAYKLLFALESRTSRSRTRRGMPQSPKPPCTMPGDVRRCSLVARHRIADYRHSRYNGLRVLANKDPNVVPQAQVSETRLYANPGAPRRLTVDQKTQALEQSSIGKCCEATRSVELTHSQSARSGPQSMPPRDRMTSNVQSRHCTRHLSSLKRVPSRTREMHGSAVTAQTPKRRIGAR